MTATMIFGYRTPEACALSGLTFRRVDYFTRIGLVTPTVPACGTGSNRRWSPDDVACLRLVRAITDGAGGDRVTVGSPRNRAAVRVLRAALPDPEGVLILDVGGARLVPASPDILASVLPADVSVLVLVGPLVAGLYEEVQP